jgi:hypothetical protein
MKKLYFSIFFLSSFLFSFAAPVITVVNNNGSWRTGSTWDLDRQPVDGDTVVIPAGKTVLVDNNWNILPAKLYIKVFGNLKLSGSGSKLIVGAESYVWVFANATVQGAGSVSDIIKIGENTVFQGSQAAIVGPMMANTYTNGFQNYIESTLPVKFVGFNVSLKNKDILVQWSTSEESNASAYELERSCDANSWNVVSRMKAAGNSSVVNNYAYTDRNFNSKTVYYRIRQIDADGKATYTVVRSIRPGENNANDINITAVEGRVVLQFQHEMKGSLTLRVVSLSGQVRNEQVITNPGGQLVLNTNIKGNSIISLSNGQDINLARQVIL